MATFITRSTGVQTLAVCATVALLHTLLIPPSPSMATGGASGAPAAAAAAADEYGLFAGGGVAVPPQHVRVALRLVDVFAHVTVEQLFLFPDAGADAPPQSLDFRFPIDDTRASLTGFAAAVDDTHLLRAHMGPKARERPPRRRPRRRHRSAQPTRHEGAATVVARRDCFEVQLGAHSVRRSVRVVVAYTVELPVASVGRVPADASPAVVAAACATRFVLPHAFVPAAVAADAAGGAGARFFELSAVVQTHAPLVALTSPSHAALALSVTQRPRGGGVAPAAAAVAGPHLAYARFRQDGSARLERDFVLEVTLRSQRKLHRGEEAPGRERKRPECAKERTRERVSERTRERDKESKFPSVGRSATPLLWPRAHGRATTACSAAPRLWSFPPPTPARSRAAWRRWRQWRRCNKAAAAAAMARRRRATMRIPRWRG